MTSDAVQLELQALRSQLDTALQTAQADQHRTRHELLAELQQLREAQALAQAERPTPKLAELGRLEEEVRELGAQTRRLSDALPGKWLYVFERLIIPVALGMAAWLGTMAATEISSGQLALATASAENQKSDSRRAMQAKFIEIFYRDFSSGDQASQLNAIKLVRLVDADLAQSLLDMVAVTPGLSDAVIAKAGEARNALEAIAPLQGYHIRIYYLKDDAASAPALAHLQSRLQTAGLAASVRLLPSDAAFFARRLNQVSQLEIRYEQGIENEAANALLRALKPPQDMTAWALKTIPTTSPNVLSIFVPKGGGLAV